MNTENSSSKVIVYKSYLEEFRMFKKEQIETVLTDGPWIIPTTDSDFWIPGMGFSKHKGMITGGYIGNNIPFGFFSKPRQNLSLAIDEADKTELVRARGVNTPPVVAVMDYTHGSNAGALVVTHALYNVEPLSAKDLTFQTLDSRANRPWDFLKFNLKAIAKMQELGVGSGDMHTGNIGQEFTPYSPPRPIFFDFENANILDERLLHLKNSRLANKLTEEERQKIKIFEEGAVEDVAVFLAYLNYQGFPMSNQELLESTVKIYPRYRRERSFGVIRGLDFRMLLEEIYYNTPVDIKAKVA